MKRYLARGLLVLCTMGAFAQNPYGTTIFTPVAMTASSQTSTITAMGVSWSAGTITLTGNSLTTATFGVLASTDGGVSYFPWPICTVSATPICGTTQTATANGVYQINLANVTYIKYVTSGTFTGTSISLLLTVSPNSTVGRTGGGAASGYGGINVFGDSITNGGGATTFMQGGAGATGYAWRLVNAYGGNGVNYGYGSDMAGDLVVKDSTQINPTISNNFLTAMMISTNDVNIYGADAQLEAVFAGALADAIAWAAIPDVAKVLTATSSACTFTGTWIQAPDLTPGKVPAGTQGGGSFSTHSGDTATCTLTTSQPGPIYLSYLQVGPSSTWDLTSNFTATVDGGSSATFHPVATEEVQTSNGTDFFPVLGRLSGVFPAGAHTIVLTNNHTGQGMLIFALMAPYPVSRMTPPNVFVGGTPWNQDNSPATTTAIYDSLIQSTVSQLAADGLNVHFVNIRNYLNSTTDYTGATLANGFVCPASTALPYHPNDCGHYQLAKAFLEAMPSPNFSGPLPFLTYYGPVRSTAGNQGWIFGQLSAWQAGTKVGFSGTKTAGSCVLVVTGGIVTGVTGC